MRKFSYISPTSLRLFEKDREQYYTRYLSENKRPPESQSEAASVGSAFDAFVKADLHLRLFGNDGDGEYDLEVLLNAQVDKECLEFARVAGDHCFQRYCDCGVYADLCKELAKSEEPPRFEFKLLGNVGGIPLIGKPDLWYKLKVQVIYDWKVMGFCAAKSAVSPKKFYQTCRDTWKDVKPTRGGGHAKPHKSYEEIDHHGHKIGAHWMEDVDKGWADQISIYSWLMGMEVGDEDTIVGIDQLCCKPHPDKNLEEGTNLLPLIRVAQHRCRVSSFWQHSLMNRLKNMWDTVQSGHIFDALTREESDKCCEVMDLKPGDDGLGEEFWNMCNERPYRG